MNILAILCDCLLVGHITFYLTWKNGTYVLHFFMTPGHIVNVIRGQKRCVLHYCGSTGYLAISYFTHSKISYCTRDLFNIKFVRAFVHT